MTKNDSKIGIVEITKEVGFFSNLTFFNLNGIAYHHQR